MSRKRAFVLVAGVVSLLAVLVAYAIGGVTGGWGPLGPSPTAEPTQTRPTALSPAVETRIAFAGDTGTGPGSAIDATVQTMVEQDEQRHYDALVLLGDLIYPEGDGGEVDSSVTGVFAPVTGRGTQLLPVLGNHDYMSGEQGDILAQLDRDTTWYAQDVGLARIIVLDTERVDDPTQTTWLADTLATPTKAAWTIVAMHKPAYSAGYHGSDEEIQQAWVPLFEKYDVPLVMAGHDHDYQRSIPINGVTYVVTGGAATLRPTGREDFTEVSTSTLHYTDLLLEPDRLTLRAIDQGGSQFDSLELTR